MFDIVFRPGHALLLAAEEIEDDRPLRLDRRLGHGLGHAQADGHGRGIIVGPRHELPHPAQVVEVSADQDDFLPELRIGPGDDPDDVIPDALGMMLGHVLDRHRLAGGEGSGLELLADPGDRLGVRPSRPGEDVGHDRRPDVMVDESLAVGVVGIADRPVVVDHSLGPVVEGVLELVLVEGVRPPFWEGAGRIARPDRDLRIHQDDLPLDVQAGVIVVAQLRGGDPVADEDDLGRHLARGRGSAGDELLLELIELFDRSVLDRKMKDARPARKDQGVGIRELLEICAVVPARGDAPFLHE